MNAKRLLGALSSIHHPVERKQRTRRLRSRRQRRVFCQEAKQTFRSASRYAMQVAARLTPSRQSSSAQLWP